MNPQILENDYVKNAYSSFAKEFNDTRVKRWSQSYDFIHSLPSYSSVFDAGCGNGRNMTFRNDLIWTGCDMCPELVQYCLHKNLNVFQSDVKNIPIIDNAFDYSICIAVIGHIADNNDRIKAINELLRITKHSIYIQCWNIDAISHSKHPENFQHIGNNDYLVSWGVQKIQRYYHLFNVDDFTNLLKLCNCNIVNVYNDITGVVGIISKH
jgi:SAM-dependent methyltransferase